MLVLWLAGKDQEHCALYKVELRKELLYKIPQNRLWHSVVTSLLWGGPNKCSQQPLHPEHL